MQLLYFGISFSIFGQISMAKREGAHFDPRFDMINPNIGGKSLKPIEDLLFHFLQPLEIDNKNPISIIFNPNNFIL
jgi:hypothetical protein